MVLLSGLFQSREVLKPDRKSQVQVSLTCFVARAGAPFACLSLPVTTATGAGRKGSNRRAQGDSRNPLVFSFLDSLARGRDEMIDSLAVRLVFCLG